MVKWKLHDIYSLIVLTLRQCNQTYVYTGVWTVEWNIAKLYSVLAVTS